MKINFLVPTTGITGGIRVIFEHANNLSAWGHDVTIIYPYILERGANKAEILKGKIKQLRRKILSLFGENKIKWFNLNDKIKIIRVPDLSANRIPSAEATIATANQTADWLADYPEDKGKKFYFIQDYESWTRSKDKVDTTWKLPLKKIVITSGLKKLAEEKFKENIAGVVYDGIDPKKFYNDEKRFNQKKKILMMYHILEKKGFMDGMKAYTIAREKHPEITLTLFGAYKYKNKLAENVEYFYQPSAEKLRELYSISDIFLWPSREEGFGLPPLEAMACKCAVVSTDTGAIRDYAIHDQTVLIVQPKRPDLMAEEMIKLIESEEKIKQISLNGFKMASEFTWEKSTKKLIEILLNY
jgi:glycosyltransferase involved in cell wall biosynthesis